MAFVAVDGHAIVPDDTDKVNIAFTGDGAKVTPITAPGTGTFHCSLPNSSNLPSQPTSVQIVTEDNVQTTVSKVILFNGGNNLANATNNSHIGVLSIPLLASNTDPFLGFTLSVTLTFTSSNSSIIVQSLAIKF
jgi:hypothetical protein